MYKIVKKTWLIVILILGLFSNYGFTGENDNPFDPESSEAIGSIFHQELQKIRGSRISVQEKGGRYAELGESALEVPKAYPLAIEAFEEALKMDPMNSKANFYHGILKPFLHLRGFSMRLSKILSPEAVSQLTFSAVNDEKDAELQKIISEFLHDANHRPIFKTMTEFQTFLFSELLPLLEESKRKMDVALRDPTFKIKFVISRWDNPKLWSGHQGYVIFDAIDVLSVKHVCEGLIFFIKIFSAYDLDALLNLRNEFTNKEGDTQKEVIEAIRKYPSFLTLKKGFALSLKEVLRDAPNAIEGLRLIGKMLKNDTVRAEKLFNTFKTESDYQDFLDGLTKATEVISGPFEVQIEANNAENPNPKKILVNGTVFLSKPIPDLKALLPREFSKNGKIAKSFPDQTFGGLIPNGDFISSLCALPKEVRLAKGFCEDEERQK
ncbi:MAG TPA: hypothetical protein DD708_05395 [Deltaproteobacteria bacterium]|nr:MAG: hypothetical protein A3A72_07000 [Deltaproteobacteria bacterium RIFCSPLOWO2_01_FULL_38_9]OGQ59275.1 MAG: hypothetical protein A3G92_01505 [Deltaproteobacteria bacterium RIFCSPLOWO2_12_FULL_38_8]HBQ21352.1 hypothetical protein [Deltaproteobacteria bacterium]